MPIYSNFYQTLTTACPIVELRGYAAACGLKGHLYAYLDFYGPTINIQYYPLALSLGNNPTPIPLNRCPDKAAEFFLLLPDARLHRVRPLFCRPFPVLLQTEA